MSTRRDLNMYKLFLIWIVLCLFMYGCKTPQEKLNRLVKKHPELLKDTTLIDYDTTIIDIPAVHSDSVIHINTLKTDTFIMTKEHLRVQTIYRNDSVFITGDCFGIKDTIVSVEEIKTNYVVAQQEKWPWWKYVVLAAAAFILIDKFLSWYRTFKTNTNGGV